MNKVLVELLRPLNGAAIGSQALYAEADAARLERKGAVRRVVSPPAEKWPRRRRTRWRKRQQTSRPATATSRVSARNRGARAFERGRSALKENENAQVSGFGHNRR